MPRSRHSAAISGSGSTTPVLTDPPVPTTRNGRWPAATSASIARRQRDDVHPLFAVGRDPADRIRAEPGQVGRLLDPGVGLRGTVRHQRVRRARRPSLRTSHSARGGTRRQQADDVRHVAAAHEQAAAAVWIADQLGDPADGLDFDLGRRGRQRPGADVGVHRRGEKVAEDADRRRRRGDVAEEPADGR